MNQVTALAMGAENEIVHDRTSPTTSSLVANSGCGCGALMAPGMTEILTKETARARFERAAANIPPYPERFGGRGIVIPGGGRRYFSSAWVCINILRDLGCTLPIELWHLGDAEMDAEMRQLVEPLGVRCVDAHERQARCPMRRLSGWELKAYSMVHSRFREVIFLDADNVPVIDPTFLFECPEYRARGAIFWPDGGRFASDDPIWKLTGVAYRDEPEVESGQAVVDKARCWAPLLLALWMNSYSDFWYQHVYGDKDTFHLAWRKLAVEYAMPEHPLRGMAYALLQHDFDGRPLFQHRYGDKFDVNYPSLRDDTFSHEESCIIHLRRLRNVWATWPDAPHCGRYVDAQLREAAKLLCETSWNCRLLDSPPATLTHFANTLQRRPRFRMDGTIERQHGSTLSYWNLDFRQSDAILLLAGEDGIAGRLLQDGSHRWLGRLNCAEPVRLELTPGGVVLG